VASCPVLLAGKRVLALVEAPAAQPARTSCAPGQPGQVPVADAATSPACDSGRAGSPTSVLVS
jgi:hypothetical protein